jgi:hypothetical protein
MDIIQRPLVITILGIGMTVTMALVTLGQSMMPFQVNRKVSHINNNFVVSLWGRICLQYVTQSHEWSH